MLTRISGIPGMLLALTMILAACSSSQPKPVIHPAEQLTPTIVTGSAQMTATPSPTYSATLAQVSNAVLTASPTPSHKPTIIPTDESAPGAVFRNGTQLAFLQEGDIWLYDGPGTQPYPLTIAGDVKSFTWAPDGKRLAYYNGKSFCFVNRDGSMRTACLELGLTEQQAEIERHILLSPDQRWVVLWNAVNPWDEGAIGWLIFALDGSGAMYRIEDPTDWGAALAPNNEPGGFTGQPLFLADGRLVGTLTHRFLSSSTGQRYQLYEFDLQNHGFKPYDNKPEEGFSQGKDLLLSSDHLNLVNFNVLIQDCENYQSLVDIFNLSTADREKYNLAQEAVMSIAFSPDLSQAVFARSSSCDSLQDVNWSSYCGLVQDGEIFSMQLWMPSSAERKELAPGVSPAWSPDGDWLAFQSCLKKDPSGNWITRSEMPPSIYILDPAGEQSIAIAPGSQPQWRPESNLLQSYSSASLKLPIIC